MTRINCGVDPSELPRKALIAEHREITRIPNAVWSGRVDMADLPERFTMGRGHVRFFYDKLGYLRERYLGLWQECVDRGYNVTCKLAAFDDVPLGPYAPTEADRQVTLARLAARGHELVPRREACSTS